MSKVLPVSSMASPFHPYEEAVQTMFGVRDEALDLGLAMINGAIPHQNKAFLVSQPFVAVSFVDPSTLPYNSYSTMIFGKIGFIDISPNGTTVIVQNAWIPSPRTNPLYSILKDNSLVPLAIMVIDFERRNRYRINGFAHKFQESLDRSKQLLLISFELQVKEAYGNCPKYIQSRRIDYQERYLSQPNVVVSPSVTKASSETVDLFSPNVYQIINNCDTFFLGTYYLPSQGATNLTASTSMLQRTLQTVNVDISHRGGNKGFLRIVDDKTLLWPEYKGNNMHMTLGNIYGNHQAGLVIVDFERSQFLHLTGEAELLLPYQLKARLDVDTMDNAKKYVLFTVNLLTSLFPMAIMEQAIPLPFTLLQVSPYNPVVQGYLGSTCSADNKMVKESKQQQTSNGEENPYDKDCLLELVSVKPWTAILATFIFKVTYENEEQYANIFGNYIPGQYATLKITFPSEIADLEENDFRTWTVTSCDKDMYNGEGSKEKKKSLLFSMTIKKAGPVSTWLHGLFNSKNNINVTDEKSVHLLWRQQYDRGVRFTFLGFGGEFTIFEKAPSKMLTTSPAVNVKRANVVLTADVQNAQGQVLFIAGGIGVTPFLSIIRDMLTKGIYPTANQVIPLDITLWASFRSIEEAQVLNYVLDSNPIIGLSTGIASLLIVAFITSAAATEELPTPPVIFNPNLLEASKDFLLDLTLRKGRINTAVIAANTSILAKGCAVYICGPGIFMQEVVAALPSHLVDKVHKEDFYF